MGNRFSLMDVACVTQNFSPRCPVRGIGNLYRGTVSSLRLIIASHVAKTARKCMPISHLEMSAPTSGYPVIRRTNLKRLMSDNELEPKNERRIQRSLELLITRTKKNFCHSGGSEAGVEGNRAEIFHFALIIAQRFAINS